MYRKMACCAFATGHHFSGSSCSAGSRSCTGSADSHSSAGSGSGSGSACCSLVFPPYICTAGMPQR